MTCTTARNHALPFQLKGGKLSMPLPETDEELEVLTRIYFGVPLHLSELRASDKYANYRVSEPYTSYHGRGFNYGTHDIDGYDHSALFWRCVIGRLHCGGVASHSYGGAHIDGVRHVKRLRKWISNRHKGVRYVRAPFVRLARKHGAGESIVIRDSGAPTGGREDGASAVSNGAD